MGGFLEKPVTDKHSVEAEGNGLKASLSAMQGWRAGMEDAHIIAPKIDIPNCSYFAVFDGHGGSFASEYAYASSPSLLPSAQNMVAVLSSELKYGTPEVEAIKSALKSGYLKLDQDLQLQEAVRQGDRSGSTAVSCFITANDILCANSGDSRAVMYSDNKVIPLSFDHKPYNEEERKRILDAGGVVVMKRVNGDLAVSRALGDFSFKSRADLQPEEQQVTANPDIIHQPRSPKDQFIVLACDGIWDVMSNDAICEMVVREMECEESLKDIGSNILDHCLAKDSKDNMSVILVVFGDAHKPIPEKVEARKREKAEAERKKKEEEEKTEKDVRGGDSASGGAASGSGAL